MQHANRKLIICLLVLIVAVAAAGLLVGRGVTSLPFAATGDDPGILITATDGLALPSIVSTDSNDPQSEGAESYLIIQTGSGSYQPLPLTTSGVYTFTEKATGETNVLHVTPQSMVMHSADCNTQDCVMQGKVTLDNRLFRPMGGLIVCLPHRLTLELVPADELGTQITLIPQVEVSP